MELQKRLDAIYSDATLVKPAIENPEPNRQYNAYDTEDITYSVHVNHAGVIQRVPNEHEQHKPAPERVSESDILLLS
jgi:hypothetical protein